MKGVTAIGPVDPRGNLPRRHRSAGGDGMRGSRGAPERRSVVAGTAGGPGRGRRPLPGQGAGRVEGGRSGHVRRCRLPCRTAGAGCHHRRPPLSAVQAAPGWGDTRSPRWCAASALPATSASRQRTMNRSPSGSGASMPRCQRLSPYFAGQGRIGAGTASVNLAVTAKSPEDVHGSVTAVVNGLAATSASGKTIAVTRGVLNATLRGGRNRPFAAGRQRCGERYVQHQPGRSNRNLLLHPGAVPSRTGERPPRLRPDNLRGAAGPDPAALLRTGGEFPHRPPGRAAQPGIARHLTWGTVGGPRWVLAHHPERREVRRKRQPYRRAALLALMVSGGPHRPSCRRQHGDQRRPQGYGVGRPARRLLQDSPDFFPKCRFLSGGAAGNSWQRR